jgi:hypothetical protein
VIRVKGEFGLFCLCEINGCARAFHLQFIPLKYPRNSAEASVKAGIEQVAWNVAVLESLDGANHFDKLTNHILRALNAQTVGN